MKNELIQRLKTLLLIIKEEINYFALFEKVIESCAVAVEVNRICYSEKFINDNEFIYVNEMINSCRKKAIETHREWTIKVLENSKTEHTRKSIVMSVYNDIFHQ